MACCTSRANSTKEHGGLLGKQVLDVTQVASVTASKALQWMHKERSIGYYAGKNGYGIHIVFNKIS